MQRLPKGVQTFDFDTVTGLAPRVLELFRFFLAEKKALSVPDQAQCSDPCCGQRSIWKPRMRPKVYGRGVFLGTFVLFLLLDFIGGHSWAGEVDGGTRAVLTSKEKRKKLKNSPS